MSNRPAVATANLLDMPVDILLSIFRLAHVLASVQLSIKSQITL